MDEAIQAIMNVISWGHLFWPDWHWYQLANFRNQRTSNLVELYIYVCRALDTENNPDGPIEWNFMGNTCELDSYLDCEIFNIFLSGIQKQNV